MTAYLSIAVRMSCVMRHLAKKMDALHYFRVFSPKFTIVAATLTFIPAMITVAFALFG
jgi:hypothetical protein